MQTVYIHSRFYRIHNPKSKCNRGITQTVRLTEKVRLNLRKAISRSYGTFNRVIKENLRTVRLIETVLIIESLEYLCTNIK